MVRLAPQWGFEKQESLLPCHPLCNPAQNTPTDDHYCPGGDEEGDDDVLEDADKDDEKERKL